MLAELRSCSHCKRELPGNAALGYLEDSSVLFRRALEYLEGGDSPCSP